MRIASSQPKNAFAKNLIFSKVVAKPPENKKSPVLGPG